MTISTKAMQAVEQNERISRALRPVERLEEAVVDDRREPQRLRAAEHQRRRERAGAQHEDQRRARGDAGLGVRHDDLGMDAPPRRAEIARGLDLIAVERLDGVVEREHHDQHVGVGEARIERDVRAEEIDRLMDEA